MNAASTLVARGPQRFGQSVRATGWRFMQWSDDTSERHDHNIDTKETRDVSNSPGHTAVITELKTHLRSLPPWPKQK